MKTRSSSMDQLRDLADPRLLGGCTYCFRETQESRDHVPSRVLLDEPYPENLPVVPACKECNNAFSPDEEYLACLVECAIVGGTDPAHIRRPKVAKILERSPALRRRIDTTKSAHGGVDLFLAEGDRINRIVLKLALGHAAFELSRSFRDEPTYLMWWPVSMMTPDQRQNFDAPQVLELFDEIGSRQSQRILLTEVTLQSPTGDLKSLKLFRNDWITVQEGTYRFLAIADAEGVRIRLVIGELLASEVGWKT
jgi:hypothetical protein